MRKKIKSWCAAIALVGTVLVGFTACSQDDIFDETLNETEISTLAKRSMQQGGESTPSVIYGQLVITMEQTYSVPEENDPYPEISIDTNGFEVVIHYEYRTEKKDGKIQTRIDVVHTSVSNHWFSVDGVNISKTFPQGGYMVSVSGSDMKGNLYFGQGEIK